jgi:hypothetical protein
MENKIITQFKIAFKLRKDIGNEYFEGEYKTMIDIICSIVKNEDVNGHVCEDNKEDEDDINCADELEIDDDDLEELERDKLRAREKEIDDELNLSSSYKITTNKEWIENTDIAQVIITNKTGKGFIKFTGQLWRTLHDKNKVGFDETTMETLIEFIEHNESKHQKLVLPKSPLVESQYPLLQLNQFSFNYLYINNLTLRAISNNDFNQLNIEEQQKYTLTINGKYRRIDIENDVRKIFQDTIIQCFKKTIEFYVLQYYEYVVKECRPERTTLCLIFNALTFTFIPVDEMINDKILVQKYNVARTIPLKNEVNTCIVDDILDSLICFETKQDYKRLMYNLIVRQEEGQIIYDYDYINNTCLLTSWIIDMSATISDKRFYRYSDEYYDDKKEFQKDFKEIRCIIIRPYKDKLVQNQIHDFIKLGFKNIIVNMKVCVEQVTYNISRFEKYLQDNKEMLIKCINQETNQELTDWTYQFPNDIFYDARLFLVNFLKWCCIK